MKLKDVLAAITPFLATDKKPADVLKAIQLASDKAKDESPEDKVAKDKAAKDAACKDKAGYDAMSDEDKKAFDAMSDEEKDKVAKDKADGDPEGTDEDIDAEDDLAPPDPSTPAKGGKSEKGAMDSAAVHKIVAKAVAARDALHAATREVEPIIGVQVFDSAGKAYEAALKHLGVDLEGVHPSAYRSMLKLAKDAAAKTATAPIALDSAAVAEVSKLIPNYNRLRG